MADLDVGTLAIAESLGVFKTEGEMANQSLSESEEEKSRRSDREVIPEQSSEESSDNGDQFL